MKLEVHDLPPLEAQIAELRRKYQNELSAATKEATTKDTRKEIRKQVVTNQNKAGTATMRVTDLQLPYKSAYKKRLLVKQQ